MRTVVLQLTLSKSVIPYLLALGCFEGHLTCIPSRELFVGHWKDVALVFCVFFRLDMIKFSGVTTNYFHPFRGINSEHHQNTQGSISRRGLWDTVFACDQGNAKGITANCR